MRETLKWLSIVIVIECVIISALLLTSKGVAKKDVKLDQVCLDCKMAKFVLGKNEPIVETELLKAIQHQKLTKMQNDSHYFMPPIETTVELLTVENVSVIDLPIEKEMTEFLTTENVLLTENITSENLTTSNVMTEEELMESNSVTTEFVDQMQTHVSEKDEDMDYSIEHITSSIEKDSFDDELKSETTSKFIEHGKEHKLIDGNSK